jgi:elongation factor G
MAISSEDIRNVAVVGHRGVGKTSLIEAMLYLAKAIPKMNGPGNWASGLDATPEEKEHVATLESRAVSARWAGKKINLIDTPGEGSLLSQARLALEAADAAILLVSAKDGVQSGTERLFRWLRESSTPFLVAITKMDDVHARMDEVVEEIRSRLDSHADLMEVPEGERADFHGVVSVETGQEWHSPEGPDTTPGTTVPPELHEAYEKARSKLVDDAATADDTLTEHYLETGDLSREELDGGVRAMIASGQLLPLFLCAPARPSGVAALLDAIVQLLPSPASSRRAAQVNGALSAFVFKTHLDPHAGRTNWVRVRSGKLSKDSALLNVSSGQAERVTQVMELVGNGLHATAEAVAGDIVAIPKLKMTRAGDTLCHDRSPVEPVKLELPPSVFSRAFLVDSRAQEEKLGSALHQLCEQDPTLNTSHEGVVNGLLVAGLGSMHLDLAVERVKRMTGLTVKLGPPRIPYRETVTRHVQNIEGKQKKQTGGHGQFGVVYIDLQPLARGGGFEFEDAIVGGAIPRQFIPSVEKGVRRALARGILAGYPVVDVKVRLVDGKFHSVDSSDAAFQAAGYKAFLAAAEEARPALLEPIMKVEVKVPSESLGDVIGSLTARNGKVLNTDSAGDWMVLTAHVPMAQMLEYEPRLTAMTSGRGGFTMQFDHYDFVSPSAQQSIVAESGFKAAEED